MMTTEQMAKDIVETVENCSVEDLIKLYNHVFECMLGLEDIIIIEAKN